MSQDWGLSSEAAAFSGGEEEKQAGMWHVAWGSLNHTGSGEEAKEGCGVSVEPLCLTPSCTTHHACH